MKPILNGCIKLKYENLVYEAFQNDASRIFGENHCANAAYKYNAKCINIPGTQSYYITLDSMTADICKDVCVVSTSFKYAAIYE